MPPGGRFVADLRGAWLRVDGTDLAFANAVITDIVAIRATACGRQLLRGLRASGRQVHIAPPPESAWPIAATSPADPAAAATTGSDSRIVYHPAHWPLPSDPATAPSDVMLFALLCEAARQTQGAIDPAHYGQAEPSLLAAPAISAYRKERSLP
jgi:hypothetical protein